MEFTLKNLLLAGIGTMAISYEKARETVDDLVKKGELTVSQGRELNEELRHTVKEKGQETVEAEKERLKKLAVSMGLVTKDEVEELRRRVEALENK